MATLREKIPYGTVSCPKDGTRLIRPYASIGKTWTMGQYLKCPTCGTEYEHDLSTIGDLDIWRIGDELPAWAKLPGSLGSTSLQLGSATAEQARQSARIEAIEGRIASLQGAKTAGVSDEAVAEIRKELQAVKDAQPSIEAKIDEAGERIEEAKSTLAALMPDPVQMAYLKVAKADATEIRHLITNHIEDDHRRKALDRALEANRLAKIAIVVSVLAIIAAAIGLSR